MVTVSLLGKLFVKLQKLTWAFISSWACLNRTESFHFLFFQLQQLQMISDLWGGDCRRHERLQWCLQRGPERRAGDFRVRPPDVLTFTLRSREVLTCSRKEMIKSKNNHADSQTLMITVCCSWVLLHFLFFQRKLLINFTVWSHSSLFIRI